MDRLDVRRAVDDPETVRLRGGEGQISLTDPLVKGQIFPLEAVFSRLRPYADCPLFRPRQTGLHGEIEQQGEIRRERTCGKVVQRADECGVETPAEALVGERRVRKAVAEDPLSRLQCGEDGLPDVLGACGGKQEELRFGADGTGTPVQENVADLPAERRPARFGGREERDAALFQPGRRKPDLGGLPAPLDPLKGDELSHSPPIKTSSASRTDHSKHQ